MAFLLISPVNAQAPLEPLEGVSRLLTRQEVQTLVYQSAERVGLNKALKEQMFQTVLNEAEKTKVDGETRYIADGQSLYITKSGVREDSWGICQFHLPSNNKTRDGRVMTKEMANDPVLCTETMAWYFLQGKMDKWSAWNALYAS